MITSINEKDSWESDERRDHSSIALALSSYRELSDFEFEIIYSEL